VSPSWRERVRIALSPHEAALVRLSRGIRPRVVDRRSVPCPEAKGQENWAGAVEGLRQLLLSANAQKGGATLVLSNHFVRYVVLPWSSEIVTEGEELEYARIRFVQIFGQVARDWTIALNPAPAGASRLCAGVDRALIGAATGAVAASGLRLRSVQPALMVQFNEWRRRIGAGGWLATAEQGRLLVARISGGQWRSVRMRPLNGTPVSLAQVLEQERLLLPAGSSGNGKVYLAKLGNVEVATDGLKVERLSLHAAHARAAGADAGIALAVCGL
jgi:hypothetical protein